MFVQMLLTKEGWSVYQRNIWPCLQCREGVPPILVSGIVQESIALALFGTTSNILNYFVWLRINGEGSIPEMRIWSIS